MPKRAIVIHNGNRDTAHENIVRLLDFFGVPRESMDAAEFSDSARDLTDTALIGPVDALAAALKPGQGIDGWPGALFAFTGKNTGEAESALRLLTGNSSVCLRPCPTGEHRYDVTRELADVAGPMAGIEISAQVGEQSYVLSGAAQGQSSFAALIRIDGAPAFGRFTVGATALFVSTHAEITNIDEPVRARHYDVKKHFLGAVPLVMFIKSVFQDVAWREQELGACLIVDDPLLKERYGRCDFRILRDSMEKDGFTTNISFIPWNWRRTSARSARFFRDAKGFSVSIHGCDHTKGEFGDTSIANLRNKARRAMRRMESHEARTGIRHDRIMVFPQGVFSSVSPGVLKTSGYTAAVNTELSPVDVDVDSIQIRDAWDVANTRYDDFPVFTRRYADHGLENFAFDLLLGKPCLIVSHHEFFSDHCARVSELVCKLESLNCKLTWRSLGDVIRRACRRRSINGEIEEIRMYSPEVLVTNKSGKDLIVRIRKSEARVGEVSKVRSNGLPIHWADESGDLAYDERVPAGGECHFSIAYEDTTDPQEVSRSMKSELSVAARRILSELRDAVA